MAGWIWRNVRALSPVTRIAQNSSSWFSQLIFARSSMSSDAPKIAKLGAGSSKYLVWVDCEMSGLDIDKDTLLETAVIITNEHLEVVAKGPNIVIHQPDTVLDAMGEWCTQHHAQSGLTQAVRASQIDLQACEKQMLDFVQEHVPKGLCPLAGNSIGEDKRFLSKYMPQFMDHLHYRVVDVSTLKELGKRWFPKTIKQAPTKKGSHRALGDILESIEELKYYRSALFRSNDQQERQKAED
eukprot:maker-scaffold209_size256900-snap-gene-0.20 protein:Tk05654 transcript:maker-scaffold209_size256900-snap-gene-0.20-mRNA-1 annotation:"PREDICTED: oligoribonuclease "